MKQQTCEFFLTNVELWFLALPPPKYLLASSVLCIALSHIENCAYFASTSKPREMICSLTHKPHYIFLKTATIPTYYSISIAVPRYIAMQHPSSIMSYHVIKRELFHASFLYCYLATLAGNIQLYHHVIVERVMSIKKCDGFMFIECCRKKKRKRKSHGGHQKKRKKVKKERAMEATKKEKKKRKKGQHYYLLFHTCASKKNEHPYFSFESFHVLISITMWGIFHYRTWLAYSKDEPPQKCSRSS